MLSMATAGQPEEREELAAMADSQGEIFLCQRTTTSRLYLGLKLPAGTTIHTRGPGPGNRHGMAVIEVEKGARQTPTIQGSMAAVLVADRLRVSLPT